MKKLLSTIIAVAFILSMCITASAEAPAKENVYCGENMSTDVLPSMNSVETNCFESEVSFNDYDPSFKYDRDDRYDRDGNYIPEYDEYFETRTLKNAEDILRNVFLASDFICGDSYYSGDVDNSFEESECVEDALNVKYTKETSVMTKYPDTFVSIERRYIMKDGEYQLSTADVTIEIGELGVYNQHDIDKAKYALDDDEFYFGSVRQMNDTMTDENPLLYRMIDEIHNVNTSSTTNVIHNPHIITDQYGLWKSEYSFNNKTQLKQKITIDAETYYTKPEKWNGIVEYVNTVEFGIVDKEYSVSGEEIKEGDYENYQVVKLRFDLKLAYPEVEYPISAPQTGFVTYAYAAVAVVAAAGAVAVAKRRRKAV